MKRLFTLCVVPLLLIIAVPKQSVSQLAPIYNFSSSSLESGSLNTVGAVYRFYNVYTGVDALVTIQNMTGGIALRNIDRTADGYPEAFQPEYRIPGRSNGYIDFNIQFVAAGTSTLVSQPFVDASGLDIDGSGTDPDFLKEFNTIDMGGGAYEFNSINNQIVVSQTGTAFTAANTTGVLFGALVDTAAKEVMFTVSSTNVSSMTFRVGADNQMSSNGNRYASLYYKKFDYQHFPLAISNLLSFTGSSENHNVNLKWEMVANKYSRVILEKSNNGADFINISEYVLDVPEGTRKDFRYTDYEVSSSTVFYRLKSVNETGHIDYSSILTFRLSNNSMVKTLNVYPSVIQSSATVNIKVAERENTSLVVTDFSGRKVMQQQVILNSGTNNIMVNGFDKFLKGIYVISLKTTSGVFTSKVIIQ
jgi:hypothetical protein